jgi:hypothetical protein
VVPVRVGRAAVDVRVAAAGHRAEIADTNRAPLAPFFFLLFVARVDDCSAVIGIRSSMRIRDEHKGESVLKDSSTSHAMSSCTGARLDICLCANS